MNSFKYSVLHIIKSLGRGGAEMLLPESLGIHNQAEFDFHYIYFLPWKDQMVGSLRGAGGKVTCLEATNNLGLVFKAAAVANYVKQNEIHLIHAHLPWAGLVARVVGKLTGVPVIYTEHNKQERYHFVTRFLNLSTLGWLTEIISVSQDVALSIRKYRPRLNTRIDTVLNGVNMGKFLPGAVDGLAVKMRLGIPIDAPVVGTVAVFRFQKRLVEWIKVAADVKEKVPDVHFIIAGDGPLKAELYEARRQLNMEDCIHFPGLQTDVRPFLAAFDIYVMSSVFEGLPVALLEAMSMGLPIVSTKAGGIGEVVSHGQDGLLVDVDQWPRLSEGIVALIKDQGLRRNLGLAARKRVEESFSMEHMVRRLEEKYRSILAKPISS